MHCRSEATKTKRCVVGQTLAMHCRSASCYVRLLPCPGESPPFPDAGSSPAQALRYAQDGKCSSTPVSLRKQRMKSATSTEVAPSFISFPSIEYS